MEAAAQQSDMMTQEEFANRLGIGMTAAYELANQDALPIPVIRVGRRFLFSRIAYERRLAVQHEPKSAQRV